MLLICFINMKECCGFEEIDRMKDWPVSLDSPDFPESCCIQHKKGVQSCNKGLGATAKKAL
jgi:hypothetical protein